MFKLPSYQRPYDGLVARLLAIVGMVLLLSLVTASGARATVSAQESYPGPASSTETVAEPEATVAPADYPSPAQDVAPVEPAATTVPTDYPEPVQPTTGPGAPAGESSGEDAPAIATPVPMPQVPEDEGSSRVSLLLVGLVLLGLVVVVVLIVARRR